MQSNNEYIKNYNKTKESLNVMYYDIKSMHGSILSQYKLPYGVFGGRNNDETRKFDLMNIRR